MNSSDRRLFNKIPTEIENSILEFLPTFYISTYQYLPNTFYFDGQSNDYYKLFMSDIQFFTFHKSIRKKVSIISYNLFTYDIYNQKINFIKIILNEHFESYIPSYKYLDFYILKNNKFIKLFNLDRMYNKVNNLSSNDLSYYLSTPSPYMEIPISNYDKINFKKIKNKRKSPNKLLQVIYILYFQSM